jgi:hypothetical protein
MAPKVQNKSPTHYNQVAKTKLRGLSPWANYTDRETSNVK